MALKNGIYGRRGWFVQKDLLTLHKPIIDDLKGVDDISRFK